MKTIGKEPHNSGHLGYLKRHVWRELVLRHQRELGEASLAQHHGAFRCVRELALFNQGIDSKLRGCDLVALKVREVCHGDQVASRAVVMQHKTQRLVQFEITPAARDAVGKWIKTAALKSDDYLFPSRIHGSPHLGTRQYARILEGWVEELGLDPAEYGTHSVR